jgi:hypothetical protein
LLRPHSPHGEGEVGQVRRHTSLQERRAYTVNYQLSDLEAALYEAVTDYVKTEMGKADQLDVKRKGSVGFTLTALQRRLASSPRPYSSHSSVAASASSVASVKNSWEYATSKFSLRP